MLSKVPLMAVCIGDKLEMQGTALVLLQFTGLLDKNGKEIYEGDIVGVYDTERGCGCDDDNDKDSTEEHLCQSMYICTQQVRWSEYTGYSCDEDTGEFCPLLGSWEIQMEIIGNIYENPTLLTEDTK